MRAVAGMDLSPPSLGAEELDAVARVLASGRLANGPEAEAFEREVADRLAGTAHAVAVSSGTAALELTLEAIGAGAGADVVTTPFTFGATVAAALRRGARVRLADVDDDLVIDPAAAGAACTGRTAAIVAVHLYGWPADVEALSRIGPPVVEDAAQAHGAALGGRPAGSLGLAGCFSFYPSKNMTTGEGGAVTTDDAGVAGRVRLLRNHGMRGRYDYETLGTNLRLGEIPAAIGRVQLGKLPGFLEARRRNADRLREGLAGIGWLRLPPSRAGRAHAWNQFTVRVNGSLRDRLAAACAERGVPTAVHYPRAIPDVPAFRDHPLLEAGDCPAARRAAAEVLSLPIHPGLSAGDVDRMIEAVRGFEP